MGSVTQIYVSTGTHQSWSLCASRQCFSQQAPSETAFDTPTAQPEAWADCLLLHEHPIGVIHAALRLRLLRCVNLQPLGRFRQWPPHLAAMPSQRVHLRPIRAHRRQGTTPLHWTLELRHQYTTFCNAHARFTATLSSPGAPCQGSRGQGVHSRTKLGKVSNRSPRVLPIALKNMCFCVATLADGPSVYWETIRRYREN